MTDIKHPITPPAKLVRLWKMGAQWRGFGVPLEFEHVANCAAQWGADQELEACCEWLEKDSRLGKHLHAARRPKPPSLKEQALKALDHILKNSATDLGASTIRRALETLSDD